MQIYWLTKLFPLPTSHSNKQSFVFTERTVPLKLMCLRVETQNYLQILTIEG